jgi:chemotaxis signal transduction protein
VLEERARLYRERELDSAAAESDPPLLLLQLGPSDVLAVPAAEVQEVAPVAEVCPIPGCPAFVAGLVSLRGELHLALDLRSSLGIPASASRHCVLLREPRVALLAERVTDLVTARVQPADPILAALPDTIVVSGCLALEGRLVPVLAIEATFSRPEWIVDQL